MPVEAPPAPSVDIVPGGPGPAAVPPPSAPPSAPTSAPDAPPADVKQPLHNAFEDLDKMLEAKEPEAKPPTPKKAPEKKAPQQQVKEPPKQEPREPREPQEPQDPENKPPEQKTDDAPRQPKELRAAYETLKAKTKTLETELAQLKAERAKPAPEDPEKKTLGERVQQYEKRLKELDEELKYAAYERSPEYQEKYEKPFIDAYQTGREKTARLKITDAEGNVRQATAEDFDRIVRISDDDHAAELAAEMFGQKASVVMYHRERVQELNAARYRATEDYRKTGSERFKKASEEATARQTKLRELWEQENTRIREKYEHFKPQEGDEEGNRLLEQGYQLADLAFSDQLQQEPMEKQISVHAALRHRAAAFGRLVHQNKQLSTKVAELEKELAEFKESTPGDGAPDTPGRGPSREEDWESQLDAMAQ